MPGSANARNARRSFAAAEASNGASAISGNGEPEHRLRAACSGSRSISADGTRSATSASGASASALDPHDADAAHLDQAGDRRRRAAPRRDRPRAAARPGRRRRDERRRRSAAGRDRIFRRPDGPRSRTASPVDRDRRGVDQAWLSRHVPRRQPNGEAGADRRRPSRPCGSPPRSCRDAPRRSVSRSTARARNACRISRRAGARCRSGRRSPSACRRGCRVPRLRR